MKALVAALLVTMTSCTSQPLLPLNVVEDVEDSACSQSEDDCLDLDVDHGPVMVGAIWDRGQ